MTQADAAKVFDMICQLAAHHGDDPKLTPETLVRDAIGEDAKVTILLAVRGAEIVGYTALCPLIQLQFGARGFDMHHLFVDKAHRRSGVGRSLIEATIHHAQAFGFDYVVVGTHPSNTQAQEIYSSMGFETLPMPGPRFRVRF